jgi:acid phosphatase class B
VHQFATEQGLKSKNNFEKNTMAHKFKIGDKVLISNDFYNGKNPKLAPQFKGPGEVIDINDTNARVKINNKIKVLNVKKLKMFLKESDNDINTELQDLIFNDFSSDKPLTCTQAKLLITKMLLRWH